MAPINNWFVISCLNVHSKSTDYVTPQMVSHNVLWQPMLAEHVHNCLVLDAGKLLAVRSVWRPAVCAVGHPKCTADYPRISGAVAFIFRLAICAIDPVRYNNRVQVSQ